jgi:predicted flap endonuclease-1-like 5' DNA nuclease
MKAFKVFLFGLLYGWFLKLAMDRIYRGNEIEDIRNENASLKEYIDTLEARLESHPSTRAASPPRSIQTGPEKDDLKIIKGIGPVIEKKLNSAGIQTFKALGRLTVAELENILGNTKRLVKDEGNLIAQAQQLARQSGAGL